MELSTAKKFMNALKESGITNYQFDTDLGTHYYNNSNSIVAIDESECAAINIRKIFTTNTDPYDRNLVVYISNFCDIHEARVGGTYEQIKKFIDAYGLSLTDDQLKILLNIDRSNYNIMPETGNYLAPEIKTIDEINKLTDEEKEKYFKEIENYEKALEMKGLTQGAAAQITI